MTWQIQDKLIYEGEEYFLEDELLEYRIREDRSLAPISAGGFSACWRGYVATFEIRNFELFLKEISLDGNEKEVFLNGLFKDQSNLKLDWLNCLVILYKNLLNGESRLPENNLYEVYEILEIKNGNLNDFKILNFKEYIEFKNEQYELFLISDDYEPIKQRFIEVNQKYSETERKYLSKSDRNWVFNEGSFKDFMKEIPRFYIKKFY